MMQDALAALSAMELADAIRNRRVSARDTVQASLARIKRLDPALKAFTTVAEADALQAAESADRALAEGRPTGLLHGVPVGIKDLAATAGLRTTHGCARFRDLVPKANEYCVKRLLLAGAIVVGKTNTPEFGFGAVCTNPIQGPTANPWNLELTSGGSSGGSAVAVATGMCALAHGTDFGGSVRTPASFCGCVGLRPTPGLIADPTRGLAWNTLATHGILARSVEDASLMLCAMAGAHPADPTSLAARGWEAPQPETLRAGRPQDIRLAMSATLQDAFRIDADVRSAFAAAEDRAAPQFDMVTRASPDCAGATQAFMTLRAAIAWHSFKHLLAEGEDDLTESFVWNVRQGERLTAEAYLAAEAVRGRLYRAFAGFFEDHDVLMLPSASVLPFPSAHGEVLSIGGRKCETIIDYLAPTFLVSLVGFPAISLPALWTSDGRPFGIQLVGRPYEENLLLQAALHLQEKAEFRHRWPMDPVTM